VASMTRSAALRSRVNCRIERPGRCGRAREGVAKESCARAQPVDGTWSKVAVTLPTLWVIAHTLRRHRWGWRGLKEFWRAGGGLCRWRVRMLSAIWLSTISGVAREGPTAAVENEARLPRGRERRERRLLVLLLLPSLLGLPLLLLQVLLLLTALR